MPRHQPRRGDHVTGERLTDVSARRIIKARSQDAGVEGFISGHSLRVGSAVSLAQAGASVVDMLKRRGGGSRQRCRRIMRKRSWQNGAQSQGSSMGRGSDTYAMEGYLPPPPLWRNYGKECNGHCKIPKRIRVPNNDSLSNSIDNGSMVALQQKARQTRIRKDRT